MIPTPSPSPPALPPDASLEDAPAATPTSFFTYIALPQNIPPVVIEHQILASRVSDILCRLGKYCVVCYFLGRRRPILSKRLRADGSTIEVADLHADHPAHCAWGLVHPSTSFPSYSMEVNASLHRSGSGGSAWSVCVSCGTPFNLSFDHEVCVYGETLFALAYLVWEDRPTRDHVFTYILSGTPISVPDIQSREAYAQWLGSSISSYPTLNHIHIVAVAYDILRRGHLLPRLAYYNMLFVLVF
ncbi:hypothetical protein EV363DRAFT_1193806 [Boletus edulis]|nr:hypothetical protein EV363DRAFT_1193806 [Boletus edulis]